MKKPRYKASHSDAVVSREENSRRIARRAAAESIVLLENDGALPLQPCRIALYGAGAARTIKGGTGSGEVNSRHSVTIREGLENAGFAITTDAWLTRYDAYCAEKREEFRKNSDRSLPIGKSSAELINIMANAFRIPPGPPVTEEDITSSETDTCMYVICRQAGECADRDLKQYDFTLTEEETRNITACVQHYAKTILVINTGGSMDLSAVEGLGISAVLYYAQQGDEGGNALADIVTGAVTPSGALTDTWVRSYSDVPYGDGFGDLDGCPDDTEYREGIYVGYRYYDTFDVPVRYPFGYGLSYTRFAVSCSGASFTDTGIQVSFTVRNTGPMPGRKIVQVYAMCPSVRLKKEKKRLAGFAKTSLLAPGEAEELTVAIDHHTLASYDETIAAFVLEEGTYAICYGNHVSDTVAVCGVKYPETIILEQCMNICPCDAEFEELTHDRVFPADLAGLPVLEADPARIPRSVYRYERPKEIHSETVQKWLGRLTVRRKLALLAGTGYIGSRPWLYVPGAAAYTACFADEQICSLALCDGPAGLRLQRVSALTKNGTIKPMEMMMDFMNDWPAPLKRILCGNAEKDILLYQNATAFPTGTALAQTWNTTLLAEIGDAAGQEMEAFGCSIWLAPGMNIHRNPLCGRNYEYFSEDPLLTGKAAAAITRGVQKHAGCYVTLKHYACNNQETARAVTSANVKERALREIYLEGFRIAVTEADAHAVMTSYNKVNHVYTPNSYDLCTNVLRNEWNFHGVVMTDWMSTNKGLASRPLAYKAGNDLIMPGGPSVPRECRKAFIRGELSIEEIDLCAGRILELVYRSRVQNEFFPQMSAGSDLPE